MQKFGQKWLRFPASFLHGWHRLRECGGDHVSHVEYTTSHDTTVQRMAMAGSRPEETVLPGMRPELPAMVSFGPAAQS